MEAKVPMMMAGNDKSGFKIVLHINDLNNMLDCAHTVEAPAPMTTAVRQALKDFRMGECRALLEVVGKAVCEAHTAV